jgi:uncharacterized protein YfaS (alpha-2-macroglobulin family)
MEQTISVAWPNVAIHAYLRETGQLTPEKEAELQRYHSQGLQRILSFESRDGGFGWYGGRDAEAGLTAYALMYLASLAKVYEFDRAVVDRSVRALERLQSRDGRWVSVGGRMPVSVEAMTAYVAWALRRAGKEDTKALGAAEQFLKGAQDADPYVLAMIANAFPWKANLDRVAAAGKDGFWPTKQNTWTYGRGRQADVEATALAVIALAKHDPALADRGSAWLIRERYPSGAWGSTQSTVLALQALEATGAREKSPVAAKLIVNGKEIPNAFEVSDRAQSFDLSPHVRKGPNDVTIESAARVNGQVAGRYYLPWGTDDLVRGVEGLNLSVAYDRAEVKVGESLTCTVKVQANAFMVIAEVAVPPGFTVDSSALEDLVRKGRIDKYSQSGRALTFYLPGKDATWSYELRPRYPSAVSLPRSVVYEYYAPDRRVIAPPQDLVVR